MDNADELETDETERPRDLGRLVRIPLWVLEDTLGLLAAKVEDRRGANEVREEIRRRLAMIDHPAGADLEAEE